MNILRERFRLAGGHAAIRRDNERIAGSLRVRVTQLYGPSIAALSTQGMGSHANGRPAGLDREAVAAGFEEARSKQPE